MSHHRRFRCPRCGQTATETVAAFTATPVCANRAAHPRDITMIEQEQES